MHIADKVAEELKARGFLPVPVARGGGLRFHRLVESGGAFGKAREIVEICAQGRWLDRRDGWMVSYCTCGQCGPYTASIRSIVGPQPWQAVGRGVTPARALATAYELANSNIAETE